jgi:uncharacterized protein (TIGR02453 family)
MHFTHGFSGFPSEGLQFMRDLAKNNNRDWFNERKQTYIEMVQEPAIALVIALGERLMEHYPISYDTRTNGSGSLLRLHRDTRFSADKSPYKTNIAFILVPAGYKRMQAPGFGMQMTLEQVEIMTGQFAFSKEQLEAYRQAILDESKAQALDEIAQNILSVDGYSIGGKELKRVPRGYDADYAHAEWLMYKGLHAFAPSISLDVAQTPALVDALMTHFRHMAPIAQWAWDEVL